MMVYILLTVSTVAVSIASPYIIGSFLDNMIEGADVYVIVYFALMFGGLNLFRLLKNYISSIIAVSLQTQISFNINKHVYKHIQNLSVSYINNQDASYLTQRINADAVNVINFCLTVLQGVVINVITLIVPFMILLSMNTAVALVLIVFLAVYMFVYLCFKKPLYNAGVAVRETQSTFFSKLYSQLFYVRFLKINAIQSEINQRAEHSFIDMKRAAIHAQKVNYLFNSADGFISIIAQIMLFVFGGIQILSGHFTIGMFTIFTSYFNMMLGAGRYFFNLSAGYQGSLASLARIEEILNEAPESVGDIRFEDVHKIDMENLCFAYKNNDVSDTVKPIISNINKSLMKGNIYALVGSNGVGKSTLVDLMVGLYRDEYQGSILYNGQCLRSVDMTYVQRALIGFAEQEPLMLKDTIAYNVNLNKKDMAVHRQLDFYVDLLGMQSFIAKHGWGYVINDKSSNTSGGEKQKIAILRILLKDPKIMIFDEPTSALDAATTNKLIHYLQSIKHDKIIIIITHDEHIKTQCDTIIKM